MSRKAVFLSSLSITTLALGGFIAYAATTNHATMNNVRKNAQGQPMVWVAKDVTKQDHYKITYREYDSNHQLARTQTITPRPGSLVEFVPEPLAKAVAQHQPYILQQTNVSHQYIHNEMEQMHKTIFDNANHVSSPNALVPLATAINCGTSATATGSFTSNKATVSYKINYSKPQPVCDIYVSTHYVWQSGGSGSSWANYLEWNASSNTNGVDHYYSYPNSPKLPTSSSNAIQTSLGWSNPTGYQFDTAVTEDNFWGTTAYGYTTLN